MDLREITDPTTPTEAAITIRVVMQKLHENVAQYPFENLPHRGTARKMDTMYREIIASLWTLAESVEAGDLDVEYTGSVAAACMRHYEPRWISLLSAAQLTN